MDLTIPAARGAIPAYVTRPASGRPEPGVVLIHDVFGMTQDLRNQADWLAAEGFLAVAPDLFRGRTRMAGVRGVRRAMTSREGWASDDVEAVRSWTAGRDDCTGTVGVVGFCMGGGRPRLGFGQGLRRFERQLRVGAEESLRHGNSRRSVSDRRQLSCPGSLSPARCHSPGTCARGGGGGPRREGVPRRGPRVPQRPRGRARPASRSVLRHGQDHALRVPRDVRRGREATDRVVFR